MSSYVNQSVTTWRESSKEAILKYPLTLSRINCWKQNKKRQMEQPIAFLLLIQLWNTNRREFLPISATLYDLVLLVMEKHADTLILVVGRSPVNHPACKFCPISESSRPPIADFHEYCGCLPQDHSWYGLVGLVVPNMEELIFW